MDYGDFSNLLQKLVNDSRGNCTPLPDDFFDRFTTTANARQIGVSVAYGVICAVGLIANIIVMFLLLTGGRKGTTFKAPSTILIMNLAVADTLFLLTLPFAISHRLHKGWKFGSGMCKFVEGVKFLNYYGSVFFITAMAVDRYLVVSRPSLLNRKVARKYMMIASVVLWCLALIAVIPLLIFAGVDDYGFCSIMFPRGPTIVHNSSAFLEALQNVECVENYLFFEDDYYEGGESDVVETNDVVEDQNLLSNSDSVDDYVKSIEDSLGSTDLFSQPLCKHPHVPSLHTWLVWNFIVGFVVPFFIISMCYARLMMLRLPIVSTTRDRHPQDSVNNNIIRGSNEATVSLRDDVSKLITQIHPASNSRTTNQRAKLLMNVLVPCLIAAFAICWLPYHIFHLLQINGLHMSSDDVCHVTRDITFCLAFFNSALNPILNSFFLYNFQQRLQESKSWVSSQLRNLSTRKKKKGDDQIYINGSRQDADENLADEATMMTSATCIDDETNV